MVNEFCGFKHGVIGTDKMPADTTLNNMKKSDLIKLLHTAQHNYETLMWFYNNAVKVNMSQLNNNGWISVEDALPENMQECLTTANIYFVPDHVDEPNSHIGVELNVYSKKYGWLRNTNVIAWQPLPAPYKKGE